MHSLTKIYISVSAKPGHFGATIFSALFSRYGINAVYLPRLAPPAKELAAALRTLQISGCSVSMPLKEKIIAELDETDTSVKSTKSCNTIINRAGQLSGFNTDIYGCRKSLGDLPIRCALIYGSGGVVPSVVQALRELGINEIFITARKKEAAIEKADSCSIKEGIPPNWDLLINSTPASLDLNNESLRSLVGKSPAFFDLVVSPSDTPLLAWARTQKKHVIPGWRMALFQLQKQFHLYEGIEVETQELESLVRNLYLLGADKFENPQ